MFKINTTASFTSICVSLFAFANSVLAETPSGTTSAQAVDDTAQSAKSPAVQKATLVLSIQGVRSDKGTIRASLLKADPAAGVARSAAGQMIAAAKGTLTMSFENLEPGDYAVQLFHDENDNGEMDSNLFGIPSEGYGFSNNARASFGPPKFAEMRVMVGTASVQSAATITY